MQLLRRSKNPRSGGEHDQRPAFADLLSGRSADEPADLASLVESIGDQRGGRPFLGEWLARAERTPMGQIRPSSGALRAAEGGPVLWLCPEDTVGVSHEDVDFAAAVVRSKDRLDEQLCLLALAGFDGACCAVGRADPAELQYLTELCRELRFSPIWMIESERDLRDVLATDAPYFGFAACGNRRRAKLQAGVFPYCSDDWAKLCRMLPESARAICFYEAPTVDAASFLFRLAEGGFHGYVDVSDTT